MTSQRYDAVAITLHWVIAAAIVVNLSLGVWMGWAIDSSSLQAGAVSAFQFHKSLGLAVLVLSLIRLVWRLLYPPPPLPPGMTRRERALATTTHWSLYGLMIGVPLSGWLYVSAQWRGDAPFNIPTLWFGLFEVPHLFGLGDAGRTVRQQAAALAFSIHGLMALAMIILLVLHVAAALKHHFMPRDGVLARMLPWLAMEESARTVAPLPPGARNWAAAAATLVIATLLMIYGVTVRLTPVELAEPGSKAGVLQALTADRGALAQAWRVDDASSHIRFEGLHAGRAFSGHFGEWQAALHVDSGAPAASFIAAVVATASATDGVLLHDSSLPQGEWFDVANHPHAIYHSTGIDSLGEGRHAVAGILTIKGHPVELAPLILTIEGDTLSLSGTVELDRTEVNMGMESDPRGQYVSRIIEVHIDVRAIAP